MAEDRMSNVSRPQTILPIATPAIAIREEVPQEEANDEVGQVRVEVEVLPSNITSQEADLHRPKNTRNFSHHNLLKDPPNPGLSLRRHGNIGFPLSDQDVEKLVKAGHRSQHMNENTWELPAKLWETTNPSWILLVKSVLKDVGRKLGVPKSRGTKGLPSALILYGPGSVIKQPKLYSRPDNPVFGVLDIILPSKHNSCPIILRHGDKQVTVATSGNTQFDGSYVSWFSDISISSGFLNSGYRLAIRYILEHKSPGLVCSASAIDGEIIKATSYV
ncbi:hypothetical protein DL98DRAFT_159521 [Cadophora sp. DSE1049]|nr:hypothetical protein DL98DRAFT_159521 [Cadophora sp. DSE1049]